MRKLIFIFALFWCSTQAMAANPCASLQGQCLQIITTNGVRGEIGPIDIVVPNFSFFQAVDSFPGLHGTVAGYCSGKQISFERSLLGGLFAQYFAGTYNSVKASGTFSQTGTKKQFGWSADVGLCTVAF